tara:strand:- start:22 stop:648 length:627 start_codon:yes stop_codon:yes gene_type:complete
MNTNLLLFNELLQDESMDVSSNEKCLISNEDLESNYIKLDCGHKYNYLDLYNEIVYQKTKKILDNNRLKINEMKCPYCRNITNKLLPFYKYYNVNYIRGVNGPINFTMHQNKCEYIVKNKQTKMKDTCNASACITKNGMFCNKHFKYTKREEDLLNDYNVEKYKYLNKMNVTQLKEELKKYKLKVCGVKKELVERLIIKNCELDEAIK